MENNKHINCNSCEIEKDVYFARRCVILLSHLSGHSRCDVHEPPAE